MFRNLPILQDRNPSGGGWGGTVRSGAGAQHEIVIGMISELVKLADSIPSCYGSRVAVRSDADAQRDIVIARLRERRRLQSMGTPEDMFVVLRGGAVIQGKLLGFDESTGTVIVWETTRSCKMHFHISDITAIS